MLYYERLGEIYLRKRFLTRTHVKLSIGNCLLLSKAPEQKSKGKVFGWRQNARLVTCFVISSAALHREKGEEYKS